MIPLLICVVASVTDADTIRCQNGTKVRIAGVSALERNGSCNSRPTCPVMPHKLAQPIASMLMLGRTISFRVVGTSYGRAVGENQALRCQLIASGAVVEWPRYTIRYRLRPCGRGACRHPSDA